MSWVLLRVETSLCHDMTLAERSNKLMQAVLIDVLNNQETVLANLELLFWSSLFEAFIEFVCWKVGWIHLPSTLWF